ncbi:MAG: electron transfer flavoprotein subunit beta/FixA family protein [Thermodesulfobacteriota bacterium]|nr:electron transfer flavoprotein subunit beta/FixA family protein [Thermodesulfobacteriota bacterium]
MNILVCIKQVGDNGDMNRFDAFALEEALGLKEQYDGQFLEPIFVDVVTIGGQAASEIIRRAFGMGADKGFHIVTRKTVYVPPFVTASKLAAVAAKTPYDLILTGIMSEDLMEGQTGPMLAEIMGFPCAAGVVKTGLPTNDNAVFLEREMENGFRESLEIRLPAVLTIQAGINTPRYPSLSKMLAARQKKIITLAETDLFPEPIQAKESYLSMEYPEKTRAGHEIKGTLADQAKQLFNFLRKKDLI